MTSRDDYGFFDRHKPTTTTLNGVQVGGGAKTSRFKEELSMAEDARWGSGGAPTTSFGDAFHGEVSTTSFRDAFHRAFSSQRPWDASSFMPTPLEQRVQRLQEQVAALERKLEEQELRAQRSELERDWAKLTGGAPFPRQKKRYSEDYEDRPVIGDKVVYAPIFMHYSFSPTEWWKKESR